MASTASERKPTLTLMSRGLKQVEFFTGARPDCNCKLNTAGWVGVGSLIAAPVAVLGIGFALKVKSPGAASLGFVRTRGIVKKVRAHDEVFKPSGKGRVMSKGSKKPEVSSREDSAHMSKQPKGEGTHAWWDSEKTIALLKIEPYEGHIANVAARVPGSMTHTSASKAPAQQPTSVLCSVCLKRFETGAPAARLPCGHRFHAHCITPWVKKGGPEAGCPQCKKPCFSLETRLNPPIKEGHSPPLSQESIVPLPSEGPEHIAIEVNANQVPVRGPGAAPVPTQGPLRSSSRSPTLGRMGSTTLGTPSRLSANSLAVDSPRGVSLQKATQSPRSMSPARAPGSPRHALATAAGLPPAQASADGPAAPDGAGGRTHPFLMGGPAGPHGGEGGRASSMSSSVSGGVEGATPEGSQPGRVSVHSDMDEGDHGGPTSPSLSFFAAPGGDVTVVRSSSSSAALSEGMSDLIAEGSSLTALKFQRTASASAPGSSRASASSTPAPGELVNKRSAVFSTLSANLEPDEEEAIFISADE